MTTLLWDITVFVNIIIFITKINLLWCSITYLIEYVVSKKGVAFTTPLTKRTRPMKVKSHNDIITHGQLNQITSIRSRFDLVFNDSKNLL